MFWSGLSDLHTYRAPSCEYQNIPNMFEFHRKINFFMFDSFKVKCMNVH